MLFEEWITKYNDKLEELYYYIHNYIQNDLDESVILDLNDKDSFYHFLYDNSRESFY